MKTYITDKPKKEKNLISQIGVWLFWVALWQILALVVGKPLLLPTPWQTVVTLWTLMGEKAFYLNVFWTLVRCLSAITLSFILGTVVAGGAYKYQVIQRILTLPVGFFKAVPLMAIIIYLILLVPSGWVAVVACFLMCFPIAYTNTLSGLGAMPKDLLELAQIYNITGVHKLKYIYIPSISPQIKSAIRLIAGISWKAVVAAEVLSIPKFSLGHEMVNAKYYLETSKLFTYIIVIVALSLVIEKLINIVLNKMTPKGYKYSKVFREDDITKVTNVQCSHTISGKWSKEPAKMKKAADEINPPTIEMHNLYKTYGEKNVFADFNMKIKEGKITSLVAPSGRGKTTLARLITGLESIDSGQITTDSPVYVSYLFQEDRLIPWLNVYDNMAIGLLRNDERPNAEEIIEMAKALEIEDALYELPEELSGGMKHRVALGRTMLAKANLLIFDEPFRGLDSNLKNRIIKRLWQNITEQKTVIVITHNEADADILGEKTVVL